MTAEPSMAARERPAFANQPEALPTDVEAPESLGYRVKCALLGPPLTTIELKNEHLSKTLALGVLSSDCISSSAYGSEEILLILIPLFGLSAYTLLLPMTGIVLLVLVLVTLTYRWVVTTYTAAGGSYVVARENFGPIVAQVGAVALMLDYIVTVAVQASAGSAAVTSALPGLGAYQLEITAGVVAVLFYGNLRGLREAGRLFAFPTYFFVASLGIVIVLGIGREVLGDLPQYDPTTAVGAFPVGGGSPLLSVGAVYILLKSFANGGSSLTGLEAISNGVSTFKSPQGSNARRTLVIMSVLLGTLVAGVSWLAHTTRAVAYESGSPTVISQVAKAVLGDSAVGHVMFFVVQLATMLVLWTGANTPFNGFPYLANFVAADGFLPRWLTKRGHRLAFSNGIIVLAVIALMLILGTGAHVDQLVAFYAIGVFTGFTLAGFGMARYFTVHRLGRWRLKVVINLVVGSVAGLVVVIFAVTKFTEGAWLVLLVFPVLVFVLLRLRGAYQHEEALLRASPDRGTTPMASRTTVLVLVDNVDLAVLRALSYAQSLRPSTLRVIHFLIDADRARLLQEQWDEMDRLTLPLEIVDCPDRRLGRSALELTQRTLLAGPPGGLVTVLLPRRSYGALIGRLLHDRTADEIAAAVSQVRGVAATIVPFDASAVSRPVRRRAPHRHSPQARRSSTSAAALGPLPADRVTIAEASHRHRAVLQGRIRSVESSSIAASPTFKVELCDESGGVTLLFYGRRRIAGLEPGTVVRVEGRVASRHGYLAMANPSYELLAVDKAE
ncbi:MAG: amino acid permease [Actinomycetota bacterium]|nr:amino acid permease [Actinomycetota bacterium]